MGWIQKNIGRPLRPVLLKILSWLEAEPREPVPRAQRIPFLQREIRVPLWLVTLLAWGMLFAVLFLNVGPGWANAGGLLLFTLVLMALFIFYFRHDHPQIVHDEKAVLLLGLLAVASVWLTGAWWDLSQAYEWISLYGIPLASASILTALLLQPRLAIVLTVVLSLILGVIDGFSLRVSIVTFFGGLTEVARSLTRAGLWVACTQALTVVVLALLERWSVEQAIFHAFWASLGGVLSAFVALSLLPYLESFFARLTNIKLLELADVNHPLLKRMSLEAPGTYHHSLIMASLAEAAAESIGANGLLCRVGAYFHDIGKMVKPEYFVENQGALGNPHDPLPANLSRLVIQSHVKDGMALARQYRLDKAISDFIVMHHGTSRIEYFYRRAIEQTAEVDETVDEDQYRYPGPRPQSKETAILMLADSVEASVRTIEEPTHQRLRDQVEKIINTKLSDGQFDDVRLTLSDISKIKESFISTLTGIYHSRIKYPEQAAAEAVSAAGTKSSR
jgi:cyclic-di-AMP phosphodiesterase PgpH